MGPYLLVLFILLLPFMASMMRRYKAISIGKAVQVDIRLTLG